MRWKETWQRVSHWRPGHPSSQTAASPGNETEPNYDLIENSSLEDTLPSGPPAGAGLRAVTAPLDRWFAIEVHQLEKEAREEGASWAQAGLPRSDAAAEGELPPEQALRRRASEIFTQWVQKVTTRVQDAIEANVQRARQALNDMAFSLEEIRRARAETDDVEQHITAMEAADRGRQATFGFRSYWRWWWFVPAILLLVAVDWVANVPVFQELLPQDTDITGAWQVLAAEAELHGALAGLYRMWYRIALSPEVALLALGVIVFLVILAHIFGESVRRIVAVHERDVPDAGHSVRQYRRQFWIPAGVGLLGGIAVVTFLFMARQEIARFAESRLAQVDEQIATLDEQIAAATQAQNINEVARLSALRPALEDERRTRAERLNYAERIRATNVPIAVLNSVLFLTAALLGYLKVRDEVTAPDPRDPRMVDLLERRRTLRAAVEQHRQRVRDADQNAREGIAWAEFLAQSRPFEDWEGRRDRLGRVTSVFRAENARMRGIDPQNIASFRTETRFDVAVPEAHGRFRMPADFGAVKERHLSLSQEWKKMEDTRSPQVGQVLALLCASLLAVGCTDSAPAQAAAETAAHQPRTVVAIVDFSGSQTSHAVAEARTYLEAVVQDLSFGDRLVLLEMYRTGSRDSVGRFVQDMPRPIRAGAVTSYDQRELDAARRGVLNALPIFFNPDLVRSIPTTDIFTTLHIAAEHLRDAGSQPKELLILSDMLQSTSEFEFAGARRMPGDGWLASQQQAHLLPSLDGACVSVIGADPTTPEGQRVQQFWAKYFDLTGAVLAGGNYRVRAPADVMVC